MPLEVKKNNIVDAQEEKSILLLVIAVFVVVLIFVSYSLFIDRTPENFTQLYFNDDYLFSGGKLSFSFFVDSQEASDFEYNYSVYLNDDEVLSQQLVLSAGETKEVPVVLDVSEEPPFKVSVELTKPGQDDYSVWFWVMGDEE